MSGPNFWTTGLIWLTEHVSLRDVPKSILSLSGWQLLLMPLTGMIGMVCVLNRQIAMFLTESKLHIKCLHKLLS